MHCPNQLARNLSTIKTLKKKLEFVNRFINHQERVKIEIKDKMLFNKRV